MIKYFNEIIVRIILISLTWLFSFIICFFYKEISLYFLLKPLNKLNYLLITHITEIFLFYIKIITFLANQLTFLLIILHFYFFFFPGFTKKENKKIKLFLFILFIIYLSINLIFYIYIYPISWNFFTNFNKNFYNNNSSINFYFEYKLSELLEFFFFLYSILYLIFQFFFFLLIFFKITKNYLFIIKKYKKIFYFIFFLFSSIITPPDIISQIFLSFILILTFELLNILLILINNIFN